MDFFENKRKKGFILVEIIAALGIFAILAGLGLIINKDFVRVYSFEHEKNLLISILQRTRSKSMANISQSPHGFCFDNANHRYMIFQGNDCSTFDEAFPADKNITVNMPADGIVFQQLSGDSLPVDITIQGLGNSSIISINEKGGISW